ncbi:MAG: hypothetical protein IKX44_00260 [Prevotella sp.]|nr:hypothetical protein [Prevotella sp.]
MFIFLTQKQLKPIVDSYLRKQANCSLADGFDKLREIRDNYLRTGDTDDLRYLLALCLRCRHGWRMPWESTKRAVKALLDSKILEKKFSKFESLYYEIKILFRNIPFACGDLTLYDTAVNIGQLLKPIVEPKDYVYLAAGAREGAGYIFDKDDVCRKMPTSVFAGLFPGVPNIDLENMLCIYKDLFKKLAEGNTLTPQEIEDAYNPHCFNPSSKKVYIERLNI